MSHPVIVPKKLIEVALPLDAINAASAREKSIRHGHPSTLHLYWARRPLAAARAVIFSQMVNDPSWRWEMEHPSKAPSPQQRAAWTKARRKLFELIEKLVQWENTANQDVLEAARAEIWKSWRETCEANKDHPNAAKLFNPSVLPAFHDPFAGGGALPLEAGRLGLEPHASDLNPVAVLINKAMLDLPSRFAGRTPVNPSVRTAADRWSRNWKGLEGMVEDVRYYANWMRSEAEKRLGHLYPTVTVTEEIVKKRPDLRNYAGKDLRVIAWLWARTVKSPNPAFVHIDVPLVSSFMLSNKEGKETYVEPIVERTGYRFAIRVGKPANPEQAKRGTKAARGGSFLCVMSNAPIDGDYIKAEGKAKRMGARLMAIVAEGHRGRVYLEPTEAHEAAAQMAAPTWKPDVEIAKRMTGGNCTPYGLTTFGDLFSQRQLEALTTFADLVAEAIAQVNADALDSGMNGDSAPLHRGGSGGLAYAEAIGTYLACAVSRGESQIQLTFR